MIDNATPERHIPGVSPAMRVRLRWLFRMLTAISPALAAHIALRLFLTPFARRINREEARFLDTANSSTLPTPAGTVKVYEWAGAGPTVLVVHGWISNASRMAQIITALSARGMRVVALDAPAHGRSAGSQLDLFGFIAAVRVVAERRGPIAGVLAHSFGALTVATVLAESNLPTVKAAVLVGLPVDFGYLFDSYVQVMGLRADVIGLLRARFRQRYGGEPEQFSARALSTRLHMPVLLVHGGADELTPAAHAVEISEQLINGEVLVVEGFKHSAPLRDPATIRSMVAFLDEQLQ